MAEKFRVDNLLWRDGDLLVALRARAAKDDRPLARTIQRILTGDDKPLSPQELKAAKAATK